MCGILAVYQAAEQWTLDQLIAALNSQAHRGPDGWDYWQQEGLFLGHRRLSIIDLENGSQPMRSWDKRYVITFNGEIYNYRELREQLRTHGHSFITNSDTEVILEAYRRWGKECLQHIAGMFAFALWDSQEKTLFVARDRVGIKPLYWHFADGELIVASTLLPFFKLPNFSCRLDYQAVRDILTYDYIMAPRSMLQGVQRLPPGYQFLWRYGERGAPAIEAYWEVPAACKTDTRSHEERVALVESRLRQAVARQMVSDVPIGVFLSGGIDSSLITAFVAEHSVQPVRTFSVSFQHGVDETSIAQEVAQRYGTRHTVLSSEDVDSSQLIQILGSLDEPLSDPTFIPTFALSVLTKQHVTVALSGDGGDELMGGYPKYLISEDHAPHPWHVALRPLKWLIDSAPTRSRVAGHIYEHTLNPREAVRFQTARYGPFPIWGRNFDELLLPQVLPSIRPEAFFDDWSDLATRWGPYFDSDTLMRLDMVTYLSENCLFKTDRASMLASLEVRVPFLDDLLLDEILPMPMEAKIVDGQLKALLLPICQKYLPRSVWDRPKQGFTVPLGYTMATLWSKDIQALLDWGRSNVAIFDYDYLQQLVNVNQRRHNVARGLWSPIVILAWMYSRHGAIAV